MPLTEATKFEVMCEYVQKFGCLGFYLMMSFKKQRLLSDHISTQDFEKEFINIVYKVFKSSEESINEIIGIFPAYKMLQEILFKLAMITNPHVIHYVGGINI